MEAYCICCGNYFSARRSDQCYCFGKECRRQRKNAFQKKKLKEDPSCKLNQSDAQRRWQQRHTDYWRRYRESHQWYTERNRRLQLLRNKRRGKRSFLQERGPVIAKMDDMVVRLSLVASH